MLYRISYCIDIYDVGSKHAVTGQPTGALHFMCPYYKYDAHNLQLHV